MSQKLISVDSWRGLEPYLGKDVPEQEVVLLDDVKNMIAAGYSPEPLSDERILTLIGFETMPEDTVYKLLVKKIIQIVRTSEREMLGDINDTQI